MTPTTKLEKDPYFSTAEYLRDIYAHIQNNELSKAKKIINDAKLFDSKFYEGVFPNFDEVLTMLEETGNYQEAKNLILEIKENKQLFYDRHYLRLYELNKILGHKKENKPIILEAREYDEDYFLTYGYKKLIEILLEEGKYLSALKIIDTARLSKIKAMGIERLEEFKRQPKKVQQDFYPDLEDYYLKLEIQKKLRRGL